LSKLRHIYRKAANIIRAKHSTLKGVDKVLRSLEERLPNEPMDPRVHRHLFFEPRIDSQQLSVPLATAETVAVQLQKFGLLALWVRVTCPNTEEGESGTVLETDTPSDFEKLASRSCEHCGSHHDFEWGNTETLYAINSRVDESVRAFKYESLKSRIQRVVPNGRPEQSFDQVRCETVLDAANGDAVLAPTDRIISLALRTNHAVLDIPPAISAWWNAWMGPLLMIGAYSVLIIPVVQFCGQWIGVFFSVVILVALFLVIRGQVNAKLAPIVIQRTALWSGLSLATYCVAAGSTGFHINAEAGQNSPWWTKAAFGEVSEPLLYSGLAIYLFTLIFVFFFDFQRGWLSRNGAGSLTEASQSEGATR
jgi:hypothetical protein